MLRHSRSFTRITWQVILLSLFLFLVIGVSSQGSRFQRREVVSEDFEDEDAPFEDDMEFEESVTLPSKESDTPSEDTPSSSEPSSDTSNPTASQGGVPLKTIEFNLDRDYHLELLYVVLIIVFGLNFWVGKRANEAIARAWGNRFHELFVKNFTKVGDNAVLSKESQCQFKLIASGRRNCIGIEATMNLKKRHDLFSSFLGAVTGTNVDTLSIDVAIPVNTMPPIIVAFVDPKHAKRFAADNTDITENTKVIGNDTDEYDLHVMTDCSEVVPLLMNRKVVAAINKYSHLFQSIHITDNANHPLYKKQLRIVYRLPSADTMDQLDTLMNMAIYFIDLLANIKLSPTARALAEKKRNLAIQAAQKADIAAKQEAAALKRQEKLAQERKNLTEEQQWKLEQKEKRRKMKKLQGRSMKVYA